MSSLEVTAAEAVLPGKRSKPRSFRVIIVLPVFNEEQNLGPLLEALDDALVDQRRDYSVVAVDDGSTDTTPALLTEYAARYPLTVLRHHVNQGLGATIRDGLYHASAMASDHDIVITMDADETHTPGLILRMVRLIQEGHDVVIASRYRSGSRTIGLSASRRLMSLGAAVVMQMLFPIRGVRDYTCGYRAYRGQVLRRAIDEYGDRFVDQEGFQCMVDILIKLRDMDLVFGEAPLVLRYDYKRGASKMRVWTTVRDTLRMLILRRFGTTP